jgi:hypothetical protein
LWKIGKNPGRSQKSENIEKLGKNQGKSKKFSKNKKRDKVT